MTSTLSPVQGTRRPLFMRSSTKNTERNKDICSFLHTWYVSRDFYVEPGIADEEWPWWNLLFSVTSVYMTLYQLGIDWSSWTLMDGEELFRCLCLYCFLLWAALGSFIGTRLRLNQRRGHCTGTSSSGGEHCTKHQILKQTWFVVKTRGGDPWTNTQTRWLNM